MISRLIAFCVLIVVLYVSGVFLLPELADTYGNLSWNEKIRSYKTRLDTYTPSSNTGGSLVEQVSQIAKPYIDETKWVTEQVQTTIVTKTTQVKQAADSVQKAIDAVEGAKNDVQKLTNFGTGSN